MRRQWAWWRPGGFREPVLARWTSGRLGLGRWTVAEVEGIRARAREEVARMERFVDDGGPV